jgi:hypothetical protein
LFKLIVRLIKADSNKKEYLKIVHFPFVSSPLLIQFFGNFPIEEVDSDLFQSLKMRLFCDIAAPNSEPPMNRWKSFPNFLSREDIEALFSILMEFSVNTANPIEEIHHLINNYYYYQQINQNLQNNYDIVSQQFQQSQTEIEKLQFDLKT